MRKLTGLALMLLGVAGIASAGVPTVPEIDGPTATSALALLAGGLLILRARKKR